MQTRDDLATLVFVAALLGLLGSFMLQHASQTDRAVAHVTAPR